MRRASPELERAAWLPPSLPACCPLIPAVHGDRGKGSLGGDTGDSGKGTLGRGWQEIEREGDRGKETLGRGW